MTRFEFSWKMIPESRSRDIVTTLNVFLIYLLLCTSGNLTRGTTITTLSLAEYAVSETRRTS